MQRAQAAEIEPWLEVQVRIGELQRNRQTCKKTYDGPEQRRNHAVPDRAIHVAAIVLGLALLRTVRVPDQENDKGQQNEEQNPHVGFKRGVVRINSRQ